MADGDLREGVTKRTGLRVKVTGLRVKVMYPKGIGNGGWGWSW